MIRSTLSTEEQAKFAAFAVANDYLQTIKLWKSEEYSLEFVRVEGDSKSPVVVLDGVYAADFQAQRRGGGRSVQLVVDLSKRKVVRELAFQ